MEQGHQPRFRLSRALRSVLSVMRRTRSEGSRGPVPVPSGTSLDASLNNSVQDAIHISLGANGGPVAANINIYAQVRYACVYTYACTCI